VDQVAEYVEIHIEQSPRLHDSRIDLGVVTGMVGLFSFNAHFRGEANHAGTTPMHARHDALVAASKATLAVREAAIARPGMTANVSYLHANAGAPNIVPDTAEMVIEMRAPDDEQWRQIPSLIEGAVRESANALDVHYELSERHRLEPASLDHQLEQILEQAAHSAGASTMRMFSSAGHDAMSLAHHVPTAMFLVPSPNGISHTPAEYSDPDACALGATALAQALAIISTRTV
jgi:beta-ureidopropionase / N-carbamoyl-L-amino-acid hydrolase